ncbi:MAG: hypothetical protein ABJL99_02360 [Aliishimia sp.]
MKYDRIAPHHTDTPIPYLSDEEIEARVFCNLEARKTAWEKGRHNSIIILQHPETRTVLQRIAAWWHLRFQRRDPDMQSQDPANIVEPTWHGHWASAKYL